MVALPVKLLAGPSMTGREPRMTVSCGLAASAARRRGGSRKLVHLSKVATAAADKVVKSARTCERNSSMRGQPSVIYAFLAVAREKASPAPLRSSVSRNPH
jgi:hypothetical protein